MDKSYKLTVGNKGGRIAAALCKMAQPGKPGEPLIRSGVSQDAFCLFLARIAALYLGAGKTEAQLADVLTLVSGGNASAARQALEHCTLEIEGEKPSSVGAYWEKIGGNKAVVNISALDLSEES